MLLIVSERERRGPVLLQGAGFPESDVIVKFDASRAELRQYSRHFKWIRPSCDCGCEKVWGHGFVMRILDGILLELKRYRCPLCKKVFTLRPVDFWPRFQTPVLDIYGALMSRLTRRRWPPKTTRQRAGHWLRLFQNFAEKHFPGHNQITFLLTLHDRQVCFLH